MKRGYIFWVKVTDVNFKKIENKYENIVAVIENVKISEFLIEFHIPKTKDLDQEYYINLKPEPIGTRYTFEKGDLEIVCNLFISDVNQYVFGKWKEQGENYTWWATVEN